MSRFWGGQGESSEEEESVHSEEEEEDDEPQFRLGSSSSEEDDDDEARVVRTAKQKRFDELKSVCQKLSGAMNERDWKVVQDELDNLTKQIRKSSSVLSGKPAPVFLARSLVRLDDAVKEAHADKAYKKGLSKANAKSLNTLKQRLPKFLADYTSDLEKFRENPIATDEEEDEEDDDDEDDDDEDKDDEGDDDDEEEEDKPKGAAKKPAEEPARPEITVWTRGAVKTHLAEVLSNRGKKGADQQNQVTELRKLAENAVDMRTKIEVMVVLIAAQFDTRFMGQYMPRPQWLDTYANTFKVLEMVESNPQLEFLEGKVADDEEGEAEQPENEGQVHIRGSLLAFCERLDDEFGKCMQFIDPHTKEFLERLKDENRFLLLAVRLQSFYTSRGDHLAVSRLALRRLERLYYKDESLNPLNSLEQSLPPSIKASGDAAAPAAAAPNAAPNKDSRAPPSTPRNVTDFSGMTPVSEAKKKFEAPEAKAPSSAGPSALGPIGDRERSMTIAEVLVTLASIIYKGQDERAKARTMLCQVYNSALGGRFFEARDLFLMSHLQDSVQQADIATMILHNRTLAQLGLCAFRHGLINEAHSCLSELEGSGKVRELLAQGITTKHSDKNPELEKLAKQRQLPYHMHINLELLDTVHLISAMLLEVPNMALHRNDSKRRAVISRPFRRLLDHHDRQMFTGPPENNHDFIMAASQALGKGDVEASCKHLLGLKVWGLLRDAEEVKSTLVGKVREVGLKTYLFRFSHMFRSINSAQLAAQFSLPPATVHSLVSKMMVGGELRASWDQPTASIVMHRVEPSRLQIMALQLADKVGVLAENNSKLSDFKQGGPADGHKGRDQRGEWRKGGRGRQHHRGAYHSRQQEAY